MMTIAKVQQFILSAIIISGLFLTAFADTHYVDINCLAPTPPYTSWAMAATNIQDAVDVASSDDEVLVADGVYTSGGAVTPGYPCMNRVCITNDITVSSQNGPNTTYIVGAEATGGGPGPDAVRGVYMSVGTLSGFTVTNGHTITSGDIPYNLSGGGINMHGGTGIATNCVFVGNWAANRGGGSAYSTLYDCTLRNNRSGGGGGSSYCILYDCVLTINMASAGGGCEYSTLYNCVITNNAATEGGGSAYSTLHYCTINDNGGFNEDPSAYGSGNWHSALYNCTISGNYATFGSNYGCILYSCVVSNNFASYGGAGAESTLNNCLLINNHAYGVGGGTVGCWITNCTITGNSAGYPEGDGFGGGSHRDESIHNSIIYFNTAGISGDNWHDYPEFTYSCTTPDPGGTGNITNNPQFGADYKLLPGSPCIDTGAAVMAITNDFDGTPRPLDGDANGTVAFDMGAYEGLNAAADSDNDGLTDGFETDILGSSIVKSDTDGDGAGDYNEYVADTGILDSNDWFHITSIASASNSIRFNSSSIRQYTLLYSTNLVDGIWTNIPSQTDVMGSGGEMSLSDSITTNHVNFYKVEVNIP